MKQCLKHKLRFIKYLRFTNYTKYNISFNPHNIMKPVLLLLSFLLFQRCKSLHLNPGLSNCSLYLTMYLISQKKNFMGIVKYRFQQSQDYLYSFFPSFLLMVSYHSQLYIYACFCLLGRQVIQGRNYGAAQYKLNLKVATDVGCTK